MIEEAHSTWRKSRIFKAVAIVGFICAVWGSTLVYGLEGPIGERIQRVAWATIKFYTLDPSLEMDLGPAPYEAARWLGPATTAFGIFAVFERTFLDFWHRHRRLRSNHITILGFNDDAEIFMNKLRREGYANRIQCVVPAGFSAEQVDRLRASGVIVREVDYSGKVDELGRLRLDAARAIISFEDEPENFGHLRILHQQLLANGLPEVAIPVFIESVDRRIKSLIEKELDSYRGFDIRYFSINELTALRLVETQSFDVYPAVEKPARKPASYRDIAEHIGVPRVLIVGFDSLGQDLLIQLSNQATVNPIQLPKVVVIDPHAHDRFEHFAGRREELERVLEITVVESALDSRALTQVIAEMSREEPFTSVIYTLESTQESLLSVDYLAEYFARSEVAVYCQDRVGLDALIGAIEKHGLDVTYFGERDLVINPEAILNERAYQAAKEFNHYYDVTAASLDDGGWEPKPAEESWAGLSTLRKESSVFQATHGRTKYWLLEILSRDFLHQPVEEILSQWREKISGLPVLEQMRIIEADPYMNFMTALEHKRWSNFYYMRGFSYGVKDEDRRRHDCLIDDWDEFLEKRREKAIYDFISVLIIGDYATQLDEPHMLQRAQ